MRRMAGGILARLLLVLALAAAAVAGDRRAVHDPQMAVIAAFGEVDGATVVPHQQHPRPPPVARNWWSCPSISV